MAITKDIVADYACPTNGTSDCRPAFLAFKADAQGQIATLNIPPGSYNFSSPGDLYIFSGIPDLTVNMTGVTFLDNAGVSGGYFIGAKGISGGTGTTAKVDTVLAGASSVTCKTPSHASRFVVGRYALMTGLDLQGIWTSSYGFPPNHHWFEYVKVISNDTTSGIVTFESPLRNTYKDTWPAYGVGFFPDQGGPATLYAMPDTSWDCSIKFNGGSVTGTNAAVNCAGREIIFTGYVQNSFCINPSQNQTMRYIDCTLGFIEVDKYVGTLSFEGTTTTGQVHTQSSSVDLIYITGSANISNLNGTPKRVVADPGTTIGPLNAGCQYGRTDELNFNGATISAVSMPGGVVFNGPSGGGFQTLSMSGGVITIPNTENAQAWAVPGSWCYWVGSLSSETAFQILDVTQDATNTYVHTSMPGGFPSVPLSAGKLNIKPHPAPRATFTGCTGCAEVVDWSQAGTRPWASYTRRVYTKSNLTGTIPNYYVQGKIQSVKFDVTQAFAGTQNPLRLEGLAPFQNCKTIQAISPYTAADYGPRVDLRVQATRTITPSGVTGNQANDTGLTLPFTDTWITGQISPSISANVSADPSNFSVTIEVIADQGVVQTAVAPLRLRLRAP